MPIRVSPAIMRGVCFRGLSARSVPLATKAMCNPLVWNNTINQNKWLHASCQAWAKEEVALKNEETPAEHDTEETFEEFTARFEKEFEEAYDLFEVQRVLNNCFSYDLVPAPAVLEKALRAARRVNDLPTAIRVFEALKYKVEAPEQYEAYLEELSDVRKELGVPLKEELFPDGVPNTVYPKRC